MKKRIGYLLLIVGLLLSAAVYVFCSAVGVARSKARAVSCVSNQKQITMGMKMYAIDHSGRFPPTLADVAPYVAHQPQLFRCPSSPEPAGSIDTVDQWTHYTYVPGFGETSRADAVVLMCNSLDHPQGVVIVSFVDGHSEWVDPRELIYRLAKKQEGLQQSNPCD